LPCLPVFAFVVAGKKKAEGEGLAKWLNSSLRFKCLWLALFVTV
jgi:hypothetical protein